MSEISRRQFLTQGGIAVSLGALIAACGDVAGPTGPGRLGNATAGSTLPTLQLDDTVLMRTAQSLHYTVIDVHQRLLDSGAAPSDFNAALTAVIAAHETQAERLGAATGGQPYECANPFAMDRYVEPAFAAMEGSADKGRDAINIAIAFEEWIARSHQDMTAAVTDSDLRTTMLGIGTESTRQSALLSVTAQEPDFEPTLMGGDPAEKDEDGFPIYYVIPARFGQVSGVLLAVGELSDDGQRYSVSLQTPADNTFVGPDATCA